MVWIICWFFCRAILRARDDAAGDFPLYPDYAVSLKGRRSPGCYFFRLVPRAGLILQPMESIGRSGPLSTFGSN
jgi:hypothetical protein